MKTRRLTILALLLLLLAAAGCHRFRAEVVLEPDGSGVRTTTVALDLDEDDLAEAGLETGDLLDLLGVREAAGWQRAEGEGRAAWTRTVQARDLGAWADAGGDLALRIRPDDGARVGLVNTIGVEAGRDGHGRLVIYHERLEWRDAKTLIVRLYARRFGELCADRLPDADAEAVAELRGLFRAHLTEVWSRQTMSEDEDALRRELADRLERDAAGLTRDPARVRAVLDEVFDGEDDPLEDEIERDFIGLGQAFNSVYTLRVRTPGEVLETNGRIVEPGLVEWEVGLLEPVDRPVVLTVKCRVND